VKRGDAGFVFDKRVDFPSGDDVEPSDWDD